MQRSTSLNGERLTLPVPPEQNRSGFGCLVNLLAAIAAEDLRFHDLRHTFASWLVQRGRTLREVQEALGHQTITMTMRYSHLAPDHLRAAVAVLDGVLSASQPTSKITQEITHEPVAVGGASQK